MSLLRAAWPWLLCAFFVWESISHFEAGHLVGGIYFLAISLLYVVLALVARRRRSPTHCGATNPS